ncbi:MAG TPA: hypothetical protein DCF44_01620 [Chitinophagaceae bacterium]|nr:hypothetical protein [Chitinophagaceae bacterium]
MLQNIPYLAAQAIFSRTGKRIFLLFGMMLLVISSLQAQEQLLNVAKQYLSNKNYEKAVATFKQLMEYNPEDESIFLSYLESLKGIKDYATAEKLLKTKLKSKKKQPFLGFELVEVYRAMGESKKVNKWMDDIIDDVDAGDNYISDLAQKMSVAGFFDEAVRLYEKGKKLQPELPYLYAEELALIYDRKGEKDKATEQLLDLYAARSEKGEEIKSTFMRLCREEGRFEDLKKRILKRIDKEPQIFAYPDLMAWIIDQQNDYQSAFAQIRDLDNKLNEQGRRVLGFARVALREKKFSVALNAYQFVIDKGAEGPFYAQANSERLTTLRVRLQNTPNYNIMQVDSVCQAYATFLESHPAYRIKETMREYAELEALYAHRVDSAICILRQVLSANNAERNFKGRCKLEMGDYELLRGDIWESTLLYSQVDKDFKNDMLGEEARYRNARLSYFTGDFAWAQGQLDVLKASTSELIVFDALNLSVLITENNPPADSNITPLLMYARADLFAFQNKQDEALLILDSIAATFLQHPLQDDILFQKAKMAMQKKDYSEAALQLQKITTLHKEDILADDALFQLALINEEHFLNKDEAKRLYEQLLLNYPGSTFVNESRKRFRLLRGDKPDVEAPEQF